MFGGEGFFVFVCAVGGVSVFYWVFFDFILVRRGRGVLYCFYVVFIDILVRMFCYCWVG